MNCKICNHDSKKIFTKEILHKYEVSYFQCDNCLFIQTEEPYWLDEAYNSAINFSDVGLILRNVMVSEETTSMFRLCGFDRSKRYLDYGGGYGIFVRMMRDNGFNFYWSDGFCENMFAKKFSSFDLPTEDQHYEVLTSFEVFEHLVDPIKEIEKMLTLSDSILFSTELTKGSVQEIENWWYISPTHGQHISFYNKKTLEFISKKFGLNLYSRKNLHFITKKKLNRFFFGVSTTYRAAKLFNALSQPKSLLASDFELYLKEQ